MVEWEWGVWAALVVVGAVEGAGDAWQQPELWDWGEEKRPPEGRVDWIGLDCIAQDHIAQRCVALHAIGQHLHSTALDQVAQRSIRLHSTGSNCTALHNAGSSCTGQPCTALDQFAEHCTGLDQIAQHCTALDPVAQHCGRGRKAALLCTLPTREVVMFARCCTRSVCFLQTR